MIGYGIYLLVEWSKISGGGGDPNWPAASSNSEILKLGRPMFLVVSLSESFLDKLPKAWFIYLFIGFMEFKQVDILWDSEAEPNGQLVLKVAISKHCSRAKFWYTLVDACIPIMNLIDWEHSHPDGVYGIHDAFGIQAAWTYFVKNLKSAVSEIKKNVHLEHLFLVADALSVTGEFHGLGAKGISRQRAHTSISSPFIQACFSNPEKTFIAAGKESLVDALGS